MKIFCVGRNYVAHARELSNEVPSQPLIFMKPKNALLLPGEDFYYPDFTKELQYECELVLQICKNGKAIAPKFAHRYYDEISVGIDFTARDLQTQLKQKGHPWEIAKAFDDSALVGKMVRIAEPDRKKNQKFSLKKNGKIVQNGDTAYMVFPVNQLISYISRFFTLNNGDLIFTGTPAGVGAVAAGDFLEGFLGDEKMFELKIR